MTPEELTTALEAAQVAMRLIPHIGPAIRHAKTKAKHLAQRVRRTKRGPGDEGRDKSSEDGFE